MIYLSSKVITIWQSAVSSHPHCPQIFETGDRYICKQCIQLLWWFFILCLLHNRIWIWHETFLIPLALITLLSLVSMHTLGGAILNSKFLDIFEWPRDMLLEGQLLYGFACEYWFVYSLVSTSLMAEQPFLPPFFAKAILLGPDRQGRGWGILGEGKEQGKYNVHVAWRQEEGSHSSLLKCKSHLHVPDTKSLLDIRFANTFFHSVGWLFSFFAVYFKPQTLIILIKTNISIFSLVVIISFKV